MNYFRKTKFRESSLIIVALFIAIVYFTTNTISLEQGKAVQEIMDARVEEAVEEALKEVTTTTLPNNTTTTTSTTTTLPKPIIGDVPGPIVIITNCPTEVINADIYELEWTVETNGGDIVYIGILVRKDDANFTRVFFTKEDNPDLITFPTSMQRISYSYQIDNTDSNVAASYVIEINVISERANGFHSLFAYDLCSIDYSP